MRVARILGYRQGLSRQVTSQVLFRVEGATKEELQRLLGRAVIYRDKFGNVYRGQILAKHGNGDVVRARFSPNLPGQALGGIAEIQEE